MDSIRRRGETYNITVQLSEADEELSMLWYNDCDILKMQWEKEQTDIMEYVEDMPIGVKGDGANATSI
jgi:hypothetical protein